MTEIGTQTKLYYETKQDRDPRIVGEINLDNRDKAQKDKSPKKVRPKQKAVQTQAQDQEKSTQFPEAINAEDAERMWFQDQTIAKLKQVYSLEQIWRFMVVQIKHSGIMEDKIKALDEAEEDESSELDDAHSDVIEDWYIQGRSTNQIDPIQMSNSSLGKVDE